VTVCGIGVMHSFTESNASVSSKLIAAFLEEEACLQDGVGAGKKNIESYSEYKLKGLPAVHFQVSDSIRSIVAPSIFY